MHKSLGIVMFSLLKVPLNKYTESSFSKIKERATCSINITHFYMGLYQQA